MAVVMSRPTTYHHLMTWTVTCMMLALSERLMNVARTKLGKAKVWLRVETNTHWRLRTYDRTIVMTKPRTELTTGSRWKSSTRVITNPK